MTRAATTEVLYQYDEGLIEELVQLEKTAFPLRMVNTEVTQYYRECLEDDRNINVVMREMSGEVIGYVVAIPQRSVYAELRQYDPAMEDNPDGLYVDTIQTMPGKRRVFGILKLLTTLTEEAEKRGLKLFSMHARRANGLSRLILKVYPTAICLRTIENWYDYGEPFDYIEETGKRR